MLCVKSLFIMPLCTNVASVSGNTAARGIAPQSATTGVARSIAVRAQSVPEAELVVFILLCHERQNQIVCTATV